MWCCIYCGSQSDKQFPSEHVIPRSFGAFRNNLTLHCVCGTCNNFFSGQLEIHFARATGEGVVRYRHGMRESPAPGADSDRFIARISGPGPLLGLQVRLTVNASRDGLGFDWIPQVGFQDESTDIWHWFTEDRLQLEFLKGIRFGSKVCFAVPNRADWKRLRDKVLSLGFTLGTEQQFEEIAPQTKMDARIGWSFDEVIRRCVAKIAFNHLAYITGQERSFLQREDFDTIRQYICRGPAPDQVDPNVVFIRNTESQLGFSSPAPIGGGHLIVTAWDVLGRAIFSHVSIFGALSYEVMLCKNYAASTAADSWSF
ncbi:MAG: hypothetical protein DMG65_05245 [Candidatus Angelobacter sp. Gp1-AA117]|nr:MAG: hypothetical protein DMG65_05245 [Candidatus Angelobacter sp. Gp1-AA117]